MLESAVLCALPCYAFLMSMEYIQACKTKYTDMHFLTGLSFYLTPPGPGDAQGTTKAFLFNHFHNPRLQVHRQNLGCWMHVQQIKQAQDNYQMYTRKDSPGQPFDL